MATSDRCLTAPGFGEGQVRLRRCMSYVQMRMTEIKAEQDTQQEDQKRHLEQMNKQLEMYLQLQQLQQQQYLQQQKLGGVGQPDYIIQMATAAEPSHAIPASFDANYTPQQIGFGAMKRVVPVISAYTRLPLISKQRRLQNTPQQARLTAE